MLQRKVVRLGLAFPADERGLGVVLVHVVRYGAHVVEELRVHRPLAVPLPEPLADQGRAALGDGLPQRAALAADHRVGKALVGRAIVVCGLGRRGEPSLVDAAAVEAEGVRVVGMQLEPQAGLQERARHPAGGEPQQAAGAGEFALDEVRDAVGTGGELERRRRGRAGGHGKGQYGGKARPRAIGRQKSPQSATTAGRTRSAPASRTAYVKPFCTAAAPSRPEKSITRIPTW